MATYQGFQVTIQLGSHLMGTEIFDNMVQLFKRCWYRPRCLDSNNGFPQQFPCQLQIVVRQFGSGKILYHQFLGRCCTWGWSRTSPRLHSICGKIVGRFLVDSRRWWCWWSSKTTGSTTSCCRWSYCRCIHHPWPIVKGQWRQSENRKVWGDSRRQQMLGGWYACLENYETLSTVINK